MCWDSFLYCDPQLDMVVNVGYRVLFVTMPSMPLDICPTLALDGLILPGSFYFTCSNVMTCCQLE